MKKILLFFILFFCINYIKAQINYNSVIELLLNNERKEAKIEFDKKFSKIKENNIDLLFLEAIINFHSGKVFFDESFLKSIERLPNSQFYITPFIKSNFILGNFVESGFDDLIFKKFNFLFNSEKFKNLPVIKYQKVSYNRTIYDFNLAKKSLLETGVIKDWQYCGVFENLNSSGLDSFYEPETYAKNDKLFDANTNGNIGWYNFKDELSSAVKFINESKYLNGIIYAQTFIESQSEKEYILNFGASNGLKIFLNDQQIFINSEIKNSDINAYSIKVKLNKGNNRLLFKVEQDINGGYFGASLNNLDSSLVQDLKYNSNYQPYSINQNRLLESEEIPIDFETYFSELLKTNPNNLLYKYYLFKAYECNGKKEKAFEVIEGLNQKYPKSTFVNLIFADYYKIFENELQKILEIIKNIETNDESSFFNLIFKISNQTWTNNSNLNELEKYKKLSISLIDDFCFKLLNNIISGRKGDKEEITKNSENIYYNNYKNTKSGIALSQLYSYLQTDNNKNLALLEEINSKIFDFQSFQILFELYDKASKKEDLRKLLLTSMSVFPASNQLRNSYIKFLLSENKYEEALDVVEQNLEFYPYSFSALETKADILIQLKRFSEAGVFFKKSLSHNPKNQLLRKKLYDLNNSNDEIEQFETKNIDQIIKSRRETKITSNSGVVILLDEYIFNVYPEGGAKGKAHLIYKITNEKGIEVMKEYSISSTRNIIKSEIIKEDGMKIPAENGGDILVFSNLQIGDVIYISYDFYESLNGRFSKDFQTTNYFSSQFPCMEGIFTLIHPKDKFYNYFISNGLIESISKKIKDKVVTTWKKTNISELPTEENYEPVYTDKKFKIDVSSIKSWSQISNWYADLVKKQLEFDKISSNIFNLIFSNGINGLTEELKARKIYEYIGKNITYSFLDFRQSGFVPQKPSKTLSTKLGDCKDLSTLFVTLAKMANLKSNLVLVNTIDNGFKSMSIPFINFNHCIVLVHIDNKPYFLELTDKFLPFKALHNNLYKANALVISFDRKENETTSLINISFDNANNNSSNIKTNIEIKQDSLKITNQHTINGSNKSFFNELFADSNNEDVRFKYFENEINKTINKTIKIESVKLLNNELFNNDISFETNFSIFENTQKVGNLSIIKIPFINSAYNRDIIKDEKRNFEIIYPFYENFNEYNTEILLKIPEGKSYIEIPENKFFNFKNHIYSISYKLEKPNLLKVIRKVNTPWDNISTLDYPKFREFVKNIIETEEQVIGYK